MSVSVLPARAQSRLVSLRRYQPGSAAETNAGKLSSNEAPLGPAPAVREAIAAAAGQASRYPSVRGLVSLVAAYEGVREDQVVLTNGSDELCYLIATLFIEDAARVVLSDPCYQIEELVSRLHRGEPVLVPLREVGSHDLEAMALEAAGAAVLWLPTPHNPTGVATDPVELERLLQQVPPTCLVVLDEAYRCYVDPDRRPDSNRLVVEHPNLIVQRTFSKSHALAGLRIGYGIGSPELISALDGIRPPFNVNVAAIAAAQAAIENPEWRDYAVELVRRERVRLERTLSDLGITYFPSQANFVTFKTAENRALQRELLAAGLVVRDGSDLGFPGWLRVSIGAPPEMAMLRAVLKGAT